MGWPATQFLSSQVVPAEFKDTLPEDIAVRIQAVSEVGQITNLVGNHQLTAASAVLVDPVQVASEVLPPSGVVLPNPAGQLLHRGSVFPDWCLGVLIRLTMAVSTRREGTVATRVFTRGRARRTDCFEFSRHWRLP